MLLLMFSLSADLDGQGQGAALTGEVRDPSGAPVPKAVVVVRKTDTGVSRPTETNEVGIYTLTGLQPGAYEIDVDAVGFKRVHRSGVVLEVASGAGIDFNLELGLSSELVRVVGEAPSTETESSSVGTVIDNRKVLELPLNGRQFYSLALLVPGVNAPAEASSNGFRGGFNVSGRAETNNSFTVNGIDNNNTTVGAPSVRPSIDDIQEFKVLTGVYSAEYGHDSGGQVIVFTKSGTNEFHGTLYEFIRNNKMDAVNYFTRPGVRPGFRRNNFGATLGGPIVRNKTFFHFSYEGLRLTQQVAALGTVPTEEMRRGDFSALLGSDKPIVIRDPLTGQPFNNNGIPSSLINPVGASLVKQFPAATTPTPNGAPSNNFALNASQMEEMNYYSAKIDHTFSPSDNVYGSYIMFRDPVYYVFNSLCGSSVMPNGGCYTGWVAHLFALNDVHVFSPTAVNEARAGIQRMVQPRLQTDRNIDFWGQFPYITNLGPPIADNTGLPSTSITGYSKLGGPTNLPQTRWDTTWDYRDTLSWQRGAHAFKFGAEYRAFQTNFIYAINGRGVLTFNSSPVAPTSGYALADALLGYPTNTSNNPLAPWVYGRMKGLYLFTTDDWKVNSRLTLNLGMRWELNTPYRDARNQIANFNFATGVIEPLGVNGAPAQLYQTDYLKLNPRAGFAWQPFGDAKTVVRGGGGFFSEDFKLNQIINVTLNPPFRAPATYVSSIAAPVTLNNPFPVGTSSGFLTPAGVPWKYVNLSAYEWSVSVQRELSQGLVLDVSYLGSKGTNLSSNLDQNQPLPGPGTAAEVQQRRRWPSYGIVIEDGSGANSHYHSLQVRLEKRYSSGISLLFAETYAKSIDNSPQLGSTSVSSRVVPQDSRNPAAEKGLSDFNVKNRLSLSVVAEMPFGTDKPWLKSGVVSKLAAGWQLTGIMTSQTGRPWTPYLAANISNTAEGSDRPNAVAGCDPYQGFETRQRWVNPACYSTPAFGTFGNVGRNSLTGPGLFNLDFALHRNFSITERVRLQFRGEAFNVFNHPNFNLPATGFDSPTFASLTSAMDPRQIQLGLKLVY